MPTIVKNITVGFGDDRVVTVEVEVTGSFDSHYGSDADGNRGVPAWFIDQAEFDIPERDNNGIEITNQDSDIISELLEEEIDKRVWNFDEDDDYEDFEDEDDE